MKNTENKPKNDVIEINIPLRLYLSGMRSEQEKRLIAMEHLEIKTEVLFKQIKLMNMSASGFLLDVDHLTASEVSEVFSEIGTAFLEAITSEREKLTDLIEGKQTDSVEKTALETPKNLNNVSKQIFDVMNNPNLPKPIFDALSDGMTEIYNSLSNQDEFEENAKPLEYVEKVLRGYAMEANK